jgi:hypothetical protein
MISHINSLYTDAETRKQECNTSIPWGAWEGMLVISMIYTWQFTSKKIVNIVENHVWFNNVGAILWNKINFELIVNETSLALVSKYSSVTIMLGWKVVLYILFYKHIKAHTFLCCLFEPVACVILTTLLLYYLFGVIKLKAIWFYLLTY